MFVKFVKLFSPELIFDCWVLMFGFPSSLFLSVEVCPFCDEYCTGVWVERKISANAVKFSGGKLQKLHFSVKRRIKMFS
jgi:hypothetical protein